MSHHLHLCTHRGQTVIALIFNIFSKRLLMFHQPVMASVLLYAVVRCGGSTRTRMLDD